MAKIIEFHKPKEFQEKLHSDSSQSGKLIEFPQRLSLNEANQSAMFAAEWLLLLKQ